jgi:oligosaccharide reducing-end xylanase
MALFFASHRWGDGEGIFCYSKEAKELLKECIHKGENNGLGKPMWEPENYLIKFITNCNWTDPSYHMPHFYELFSKWSYEEDKEFWKKAAEASRSYLKKACNPVTGLSAEYGNYDGSPMDLVLEEFGGRHDWFYSDSYRTIANIALDHSWFHADNWGSEIAEKYQSFFIKEVNSEEEIFGVYLIDGTKLEEKILHPIGLLATIAQASVAADGENASYWVKKFWSTPLRNGNRRYYDNCLYMFAMLALSGNYRIW